jgi:PAS domain S-box-containing protein
MEDKEQRSESRSETLRRQAEEVFGPQFQEGKPLSRDFVQRLVHELEVHQVELEMQNEELQQTQGELEKSRDRYLDLYDFAPVGYLSLNKEGIILEANLTTSTLLGVERKKLIRQRLGSFVFREDQDRYYFYIKNLFAAHSHQTEEMRLIRSGPGGEACYALIEGITTPDDTGELIGRLSISDISKQKAAEQALAESEERFRTMSDFTQDWEYWLGPEREFIYISPSCEAICGYTPEELRNTPGLLTKMLYPEDRQAWQEHEAAIIKSNQPGSLDLRILTRSGELRWINHVCRPVYSSSGQGLGRRISNRDITERKLAEEALRDSQANLKALLEFTTGIVWSVDRQYRLIAGNDRFQKNYIPVIGRVLQPGESTLLENLPDIYEEWRGYYERALAGETFTIDLETRMQPEQRYLEYTFRPVRTAAGDISGVIVSGRDVTDRQRTQAALEQSEDRFARAFFDAPIPLNIVRASDGKFIEVNERFIQLFGYSREELIGHTSAESGFYSIVAEGVGANDRLSAGGHLRNQEIILSTKAGAPLWVLVSTVPVLMNGEECILGTLLDITERKKAEKEQERLIDQLARARELQEVLSARLLEAQENERRVMARELHDEVGQALTALKINLQTVQRRHNNGVDLSESIAMVEAALQQVRAISLNLPPTVLEDLGLAPALRWLLDRQGREAGFETAFKAGLGETRLPTHIEIVCFRVAQEALTNIMRHARARQVRIELAQAGEELHLTVQDDGQGFDVDAAYARARQGTSLGLISMQERVILSGGRMEIESMGGQGTKIHASFPLVQHNLNNGHQVDRP